MYKTVGIDNNFLGIEDEFSTFENSKVVILPVPYERTVSYGGGTKNGPNAILNASHYVEFYDEETRREIHRELGIATLQPMSFTDQTEEESLQQIYSMVTSLLKEKKFIVMLGGEHTIS
jgi:agmatinase